MMKQGPDRASRTSVIGEASDHSLIPDGRFRSEADIDDRPASISSVADDPGCVKTHTVAKCRKNNSPRRHHASRVQYDLTLRYAIPSRSFYARSKGWSFYTAKTLSGHERPL